MPTCKNCHRNISKFDSDVCPYCGEKDPIESSYKTKDVTQFVDPLSGEYELYKSKSKKTMVILMMTLGLFGVPYFYIGKKKEGFIALFSSLVIIGGVGCLLFFTCLSNAWAFLIPFFALYLLYLILGFVLKGNDSLKDNNGEFLH